MGLGNRVLLRWPGAETGARVLLSPSVMGGVRARVNRELMQMEGCRVVARLLQHRVVTVVERSVVAQQTPIWSGPLTPRCDSTARLRCPEWAGSGTSGPGPDVVMTLSHEQG